LKQSIQEQEEKLQELRRQLDAMPTPARIAGEAKKGPRVSISIGMRRGMAPSPRCYSPALSASSDHLVSAADAAAAAAAAATAAATATLRAFIQVIQESGPRRTAWCFCGQWSLCSC